QFQSARIVALNSESCDRPSWVLRGVPSPCRSDFCAATKSAPAQKARPAPERTTTRVSPSASEVRNASPRAAIAGRSSALFFSALSSVTQRTLPRSSLRTTSLIPVSFVRPAGLPGTRVRTTVVAKHVAAVNTRYTRSSSRSRVITHRLHEGRAVPDRDPARDSRGPSRSTRTHALAGGFRERGLGVRHERRLPEDARRVLARWI